MDTKQHYGVSRIASRNSRNDGTDAFDTIYIGCEKFPYRDSFSLSMSGII
ncbi:MAG: hypothetical protein HDS69_10385 [Bacteroidales bacterium]|nr:hypothetical protein [Bacteroidales bacterium]MBD5230421.1 hypothetical protein [Bacteroidales bacterium]